MRPVRGSSNPGRVISILGGAIAQSAISISPPGIEFAFSINGQAVRSSGGDVRPVRGGSNPGRGASIGRGTIAQSAIPISPPGIKLAFGINGQAVRTSGGDVRPVRGGSNPGRGIPILGSAIAQLPRTTITPGIEFALFVNCQGVQSTRGNSLPIGRGLNSGRGSSIGRGAVAQSAAKVTSPAVEFPFLVNSETAGACCGNSGPLGRRTHLLPAVPGVRSGLRAPGNRPLAHPYFAFMGYVVALGVVGNARVPGLRVRLVHGARFGTFPAVPAVRSRFSAPGNRPLAHPYLAVMGYVHTRPVVQGSRTPGRRIRRNRCLRAHRKARFILRRRRGFGYPQILYLASEKREKRNHDHRDRELGPEGTPKVDHKITLLCIFLYPHRKGSDINLLN